VGPFPYSTFSRSRRKGEEGGRTCRSSRGTHSWLPQSHSSRSSPSHKVPPTNPLTPIPILIHSNLISSLLLCSCDQLKAPVGVMVIPAGEVRNPLASTPPPLILSPFK